MSEPVRLNLGAGDRVEEGFLSVDIVEPADVVTNLALQWPWPDDSVDEVHAYDIFEHLPDKRHTMNELWRVMRHGAQATIEVPDVSRGTGGFQDPTHVSYWTPNDFLYYWKGHPCRDRFRGSKYYDVHADFKIVEGPRVDYFAEKFGPVYKVRIVLEAIKNPEDGSEVG